MLSDKLLKLAVKYAPTLGAKLGTAVGGRTGKALESVAKNPIKTGIAAVVGKMALDKFTGTNHEAKLLAKLKAEGVIGDKPTQMSEEEFKQHFDRSNNTPFSPLSTGLEVSGVGGLLGSLITPFINKDEEMAKLSGDRIRSFQAGRAGRARVKQDTGFDLEGEKTVDELYGKENSAGNAEGVDFTDDPLGYLTGTKKKPTAWGSDEDKKKDLDYKNWYTNEWSKVKDSKDQKEIVAALKTVPESARRSSRYLDLLHSTFKKGYKGSDITSDSGKKDFKSFVQGIVSPTATFDTATGTATPAPIDPSRRTPQDLLTNFLDPQGYEWDSEDAYKQSGMAPHDIAGNPSAVPTAKTTSAPAPAVSVPDAVRTSAAGPAKPMSIAEQQAADIRKRGAMTAADQTAQDIDFGNQMYNKANPNAPVGSLAAREAALARIRPNVLQASGLYEYKTTNGGTNFASTSPDAMTPYSGQTNREVAYQKHFGEEDGPWVGDNPLTGKFKDNRGQVWGSQDEGNAQNYANDIIDGIMKAQDPEALAVTDNSQTPTGQENEAQDFANNSIADGLRSSKDARITSFLRARVNANKIGDRSLDGMSSDQYHAPSFNHFTKTPSMVTRGAGPNVNQLLQQQQSGRRQSVIDSLRASPQATQSERQTSNSVDGLLQQQQFGRNQNVIDSLRSPQQSMPWTQTSGPVNQWTPQAGGVYNGQNMSRADSEPSGPYGNPKLNRRRR